MEASTIRAAVGIGPSRRRPVSSTPGKMGFTIEGFLPGRAPETEDKAYLLQNVVRQGLDESAVGWKIGCTSEGAREILGISSRFFGPIVESAFRREIFWLPRIEARRIDVEGEMAFIMGADLPPRSEPYFRTEMAGAIDKFCPVIEVISSSFRDFETIGACANIADLGVNDGLVIHETNGYDPRLGLRGLSLSMKINGEVVGTGVAVDVLDGPVEALKWLANELSYRSLPIIEGMVVSTGTCTGLVWLEPGQKVEFVTDFSDSMMLYGDKEDFDIRDDGQVSPKMNGVAQQGPLVAIPPEVAVHVMEESFEPSVIDASDEEFDADDINTPELEPPTTERILHRALRLAAVARRFGAEQEDEVSECYEVFLPRLNREALSARNWKIGRAMQSMPSTAG